MYIHMYVCRGGTTLDGVRINPQGRGILQTEYSLKWTSSRCLRNKNHKIDPSLFATWKIWHVESWRKNHRKCPKQGSPGLFRCRWRATGLVASLDACSDVFLPLKWSSWLTNWWLSNWWEVTHAPWLGSASWLGGQTLNLRKLKNIRDTHYQFSLKTLLQKHRET